MFLLAWLEMEYRPLILIAVGFEGFDFERGFVVAPGFEPQHEVGAICGFVEVVVQSRVIVSSKFRMADMVKERAASSVGGTDFSRGVSP